jgi:transposase
MLQPVCRRTWAPQGRTPILRQWERHDRLSTISALSLAPRRRRFGLYWAQHHHNIRGPDILRFLQALQRHLPRGFTLIWDRHRPHWASLVATWLARQRRIVVQWLPPYAPDLNPVEHVWGHTKYADLANFAPADLAALDTAVLASLTRTRGQRALLAAFFRAAGLAL